MVSRLYPTQPLVGVSIALWRRAQILLVERAKDPSKGLWALPGGLVELGETLEQAARRELMEETAMMAGDLVFVRTLEIIHRDEHERVQSHYILSLFTALAMEGAARPGDDASAVRWCDPGQLAQLPMQTSSRDVIGECQQAITQM